MKRKEDPMVRWNPGHEGQETHELVGPLGDYSLYRDRPSRGGRTVLRSTGLTAGSVLGGSLLGAALMYLFDPQAGDRRRHRLVAAGEGAWDAARVAARHGAEGLTGAAEDAYAAREAGENVYNRARGWAHDVRQRVGDLVHGPEPVDDDMLVRRVRAQMGHHTRHAHSIRVSATDGHVLLAGPVPRAELDA